MSSTATALTPGETATRRPFAERLRQARSKRNEDWWSIVFGGPIAQFLTALIADVGWITPNRLTYLSFLTKLVAAPLILVDGTAALIAVIALMQANVVLDCMDGILARYRKRPSVLGGFLDKVTDAIGLLAIMGCFGLRVFRDTGDAWAFAVVLAGVGLWLTRIYAYWIVAFYEQDKAMPRPSAGGAERKDFGELDLGGRLAYYAASTWRVVLVAEADAFFWLALGLATGWLRPIAYGYGGGLALWSIIWLVKRTLRVVEIDAHVRSSR